MTGKKRGREFYSRDTLDVAEQMVGDLLVRDGEENTVGKIVETEAYVGDEDPASHAYQGKVTDRNELMFGTAGHAYVYLIYGMYHCFNVVTGCEGEPGAVLVRALEPVEGIDIMFERRGVSEKRELTNGPGKLCMAMGIDDGSNGLDMCGDELYLVEREAHGEVVTAPRVNIDYAGDAKDWPWRFLLEDNRYVSVPP